ncbi:MAG: GerMN domain-containing protein [Lachnospiraceae bacterium]|nr:GerMN domain-containing protein [Lachnospiraceae bacterium]
MIERRIFFCFLLLFGLLSGCGMRAGKEQGTYQIYYLGKDNNYITGVDYEIEAPQSEKEAVVEELLKQLSLPAKKVDYSPAIQKFTVLGYTLLEEQITLNLSQEYRNLEAIEEVLIRAALVKTLTQLEGISYVTIQINGENLMDNSGMPVGVMTADTFIDNTGEEMKNYEETEVVLYFANTNGDRLVKVNRSLMYNTNISKEKLVVEQLIKGPLNQGGSLAEEIRPTINPETRILSVNVKDGICYVNLDDHFLTSVYTASADTVIYSLVNSLTELPGVIKVQIAIEGETKILYQEKYDLSTPFEANPDIVQPVESAEAEE